MIIFIILCSDDSIVSLNAGDYLRLGWHPKAKSKFFNKKAAEEFEEHESYHGRSNPRKRQRTMLEAENMKKDNGSQKTEKLQLGAESNKEGFVSHLRRSIEEKERTLECPVCLETVTEPPIYRCQQEHLICSTCRAKIKECPECRETYSAEPVRHRYMGQ